MDPALVELARWWSWRRQRLDRSCRGVEDALLSVVAVPSVHPHGPLALLARVPRLMRGAAVEGVIGTRRALRLPAMRRSIFLLPTQTAHLAFWACRDERRYRWLVSRTVGEATYKRLRGKVLAAATAPRSIDEIRAAIPRAPRDLGPVVQALCAEGALLRIKPSSLRTNDLTYCATEAWLGGPLRPADPDEALTWLAGDYLTGFGPASVEDFAWWAGVARARAQRALWEHEPVDVGGGLLLHRRDERAFAGTRPMLGRVSLLPKWDPYPMGYAAGSRARFCEPRLLPLVYDAGGDAQPMVLVEGEVQGLWDLRLARDHATVRFRMFDAPGPKLQAALDAEAELAAAFLEAPRVVIERERAARRPARRRPPTPRPRRRPRPKRAR